jgi:general secretion pathway protein D
LLITPNINADRTVTLRVAQENSTLNRNGGQVPVATSTGFTNVPVDTVRRATVTGTVVAKDGLAVALGGLIDESLTDQRAEVPILGKLPVVGFFFRSQQTNRTRKELVLMIRPYVFNTPAESAALSHDLIADLSLHPLAPDAVGTLNSFNAWEVLRANPPECLHQQTFRFHSLEPKRY